MRAVSWKVVRGGLVLAVAILCGGPAYASASDACALLTAPEVSSVLGTPAKAGHPSLQLITRSAFGRPLMVAPRSR